MHMARLPDFTARVNWFSDNRPEAMNVILHLDSPVHAGWRMLSIVDEDRLRRLLAPMLDPLRTANERVYLYYAHGEWAVGVVLPEGVGSG